jgi:flagellar biosynthesis anti-sigma factor FlgM
MTIRSLDPSGELGKLFLQVQSKTLPESRVNPSQQAQTTPSSDAVDLSVLAKTIQEQTARATTLPDIRAEKVQQVQRALDRGEAPVSSDQVSDAMIRETILNTLAG